MKNLVLILSLCLFFSCQSAGEPGSRQNTESEKDSLTEFKGKPVIGLLPVQFDKNEAVAEALGEAYSKTLEDLLVSMQTYDLRPLHLDYSEEDLLNRGFDNLIQAEAGFNQEGSLILTSSVLDGREGKELVSLERETRDYLNVFPLAEEMVQIMIEDFYGSHIALSSLKVIQDDDFLLFVDGVYRPMDNNNRISLLAGKHDLLFMGLKEDAFYIRKLVFFDEGEEKVVDILTVFQNQALYLGAPKNFTIDGNPEEWENIDFLGVDDDGILEVNPLYDISGMKFTADRDRIYGLLQFENESPALNHEMKVIVNLWGSGQFSIDKYSNGSISVGSASTARIGSKGAIDGKYLEFSLSLKDIQLTLDKPLNVVIKIFNDLEMRSPQEEKLSAVGKLYFTENPSDILLWKNREYKAGSAGSNATYFVPGNIISIDGQFSDWGYIPVITEDTSTENEGDLIVLKAALSEENFYLNLKSLGKWDKNSPVTLELDIGREESVSLLIEEKTILLIQGNRSTEIEGIIDWKRDNMELSLSLSFLDEIPEYLNVMRVERQGGNRLDVIPYF